MRAILAGQRERKNADTTVLEVVAGKVGSGKLMVATMATEDPEELWEDYRKIFHQLGVQRIEHLYIQDREAALAEDAAAPLSGASVLFFTGGDQLRITSQLGDSKVYRAMEETLRSRGTVAGTSPGASVMSETMLVSGDGDKSHKLDEVLGMAPGFGLIKNMVVDQHFARPQRRETLRPPGSPADRLSLGTAEQAIIRGAVAREVGVCPWCVRARPCPSPAKPAQRHRLTRSLLQPPYSKTATKR